MHTVECNSCLATYRVSGKRHGTNITCRKCGHTIAVNVMVVPVQDIVRRPSKIDRLKQLIVGLGYMIGSVLIWAGTVFFTLSSKSWLAKQRVDGWIETVPAGTFVRNTREYEEFWVVVLVIAFVGGVIGLSGFLHGFRLLLMLFKR